MRVIATPSFTEAYSRAPRVGISVVLAPIYVWGVWLLLVLQAETENAGNGVAHILLQNIIYPGHAFDYFVSVTFG